MGDQEQIAAVLASMDGVFSDMASTVDAEDLDRRRQLIAMRRRLSDRFADLNGAVEQAVSIGRISQEQASAYYQHFATFRRALSLHHAQWPTILISDDMAGYVAASHAVRRKREVFMSWMRLQFLPGMDAR